MDIKTDIRQTLDELNSATGITFSMDSDMSEEETLEKLKLLLNRYKGVNGSKDDFYIRLFEGKMDEAEIAEGTRKFHLSESGYKILFLLDFKDTYTDMDITIITSLFYPAPVDVIRVDDRTLCVIQYSQVRHDREKIEATAHEIQDMIETQSMNPVRISYDEPFVDYKEASYIYRHLQLIRKVGPLFNSDRYVYGYYQMGLEKILYLTDTDILTDYCFENMPDANFKELDMETVNTIRTFLESDLSIAETARKLYLHRNTLVYRLDKFQKDTGLDVRKFQDAFKCHMGFLINKLI
ncbi:MAG: helix-turn-helix domain-containing protein [Lachnospiraceae bacterium]|nr:helix-turn-helix domain-containing protein [Lachnospiraceae bacterium]